MPKPSPIERAVADLQQALTADSDEQAIKALGALLVAGLGSLERIADSLEALVALKE